MANDAFIELLASWRADPRLFVREALGAVPEPWQDEALEAVVNRGRVAIRSGHGIGKAQAYDDVVPTPSGRSTWGSLGVGDFVLGADGSPARIVATQHFRRMPMYRVTFDDGSSVRVSSGHLWTVRGRQERRNGLDTWRTLETIDLLNLGVKRPNGRAEARQWEIPIQGPAQFFRREVPIHPYLMGVWLGDGSRGRAGWTKPCPAITRKVAAIGYEVTTHADGKANYVRGIKKQLTDPVFELSSHERYVPAEYLFNDVETRRDVLWGLLDTDGEIHGSGSIGYCSTSLQLANDVIWLARSLGYKAMMHPTPKQGRFNGEDKRIAYRVTVNATDNGFTHPEKRLRYKPSEERYVKRWIDSIEPAGEADGMCITVDREDGLYLTDDFVVTHNSAFLAWLVLWFGITRANGKIPTTAPTSHQLEDILVAEVRKWADRLRLQWPFLARQIVTTQEAIRFGSGTFAPLRTATKDRPEALQGFHADDLLFLLDEASGIDDVIFEVAGGALSTKGAMVVMTGNPTRTSGYFYNAFHAMREHWHCLHVPCTASSQVAKQYIEQVAQEHGTESNVYRVRVLGEFPLEEDSVLIPLHLIEAATQREVAYQHLMPVWGLDVARFGSDDTALAKRRGNQLMEPVKTIRHRDLMQVAGWLMAEYQACDDADKPSEILIDSIGLGAGVLDRCRELSLPVRGINVGEAPSVDGKYLRLRDELWWRAREWFAARDCAIPEDARLIGELTSVQYSFASNGKLKIEDKDSLRRRGLKSPDVADALVLTFAGGLDRPAKPVRYARYSRRGSAGGSWMSA